MLWEPLLKLGPWMGPVAIVSTAIVGAVSGGILVAGLSDKNYAAVAASTIALLLLGGFWVASY